MKFFSTILLFILAIPFNIALANGDAPDFMRSIGKIYVVVGVIVATFVGIGIFLLMLDSKLKKLEKQVKKKNTTNS